MRARVFVTLKPSVFDPQGTTVAEALHTLGYNAVKDVRQGKYFELDIAACVCLTMQPQNFWQIIASVPTDTHFVSQAPTKRGSWMHQYRSTRARKSGR